MKKNNTISTILLSLTILFIVSCNKTPEKYANVPAQYHNLIDTAMNIAGTNSAELQKALDSVPTPQKEGMAFLIAYMPECDLITLSADFLLENCKYAYQAKSEFVWAKDIPDSIFFNEVLPYSNLNERRDNWRADFYNRFSKYVKDCKTVEEAIYAINKHIQNEVNVEYNTKREKADQSPYESMKINMASCSGLSILLADALRSVGIPARVAGVPLWYDESGNHNWVEVWINGNWYFTEYGTEDSLDNGWVVAKAGKAEKNSRDGAIYAASYKPAETSFNLVWDTLNTLGWINAENVSERYINLAAKQKAEAHIHDHQIKCKVWFLQDKKLGLISDNRIAKQIDIYSVKAADEIIDRGVTADSKRDMNDYLFFILERNSKYLAKYIDASGKTIEVKFTPKDTLILGNK
ncbi:MAG: transglutaminase-like domain-containing protein [Ignavibacteria bacterium]|jgi:hypothetical protein|nr:transglutaminase-like domain-containing protein [Ignavibacteria bacterium]